MTGQVVISVKDIKKYYDSNEVRVKALDGVSFEIVKGDMVSIMGPSGSGKSTLMNMIGCLDVPTSGEIIIDGEKTSGCSEKQLAIIRGKKVGFVFQQFNLLPYLTALENVAMPLIYQGIKEKERLRRATVALEKVGLDKRMKHLPSELSGGQKQRVAIARAIVTEPSIILADEPTGALDSKTGEEVMALFHSLNNEGRTIIIVTHDIRVGNECRTIIRIKDGRIEV